MFKEFGDLLFLYGCLYWAKCLQNVETSRTSFFFNRSFLQLISICTSLTNSHLEAVLHYRMDLSPTEIMMVSSNGVYKHQWMFHSFLNPAFTREIGDNQRAENCYKTAAKLKPQVTILGRNLVEKLCPNLTWRFKSMLYM